MLYEELKSMRDALARKDAPLKLTIGQKRLAVIDGALEAIKNKDASSLQMWLTKYPDVSFLSLYSRGDFNPENLLFENFDKDVALVLDNLGLGFLENPRRFFYMIRDTNALFFFVDIIKNNKSCQLEDLYNLLLDNWSPRFIELRKSFEKEYPDYFKNALSDEKICYLWNCCIGENAMEKHPEEISRIPAPQDKNVFFEAIAPNLSFFSSDKFFFFFKFLNEKGMEKDFLNFCSTSIERSKEREKIAQEWFSGNIWEETQAYKHLCKYSHQEEIKNSLENFNYYSRMFNSSNYPDYSKSNFMNSLHNCFVKNDVQEKIFPFQNKCLSTNFECNPFFNIAKSPSLLLSNIISIPSGKIFIREAFESRECQKSFLSTANGDDLIHLLKSIPEILDFSDQDGKNILHHYYCSFSTFNKAPKSTAEYFVRHARNAFYKEDNNGLTPYDEFSKKTSKENKLFIDRLSLKNGIKEDDDIRKKMNARKKMVKKM